MIASLYVHIPFCEKKCDYCDFFSVPIARFSESEKTNILRDYTDSVLNEIAFYVKKYKITEWKTIYAGGGTPSKLSPELLEKLIKGAIDSLQNDYSEKKICQEITVEINPSDVTSDLIFSLKKAKVNRVSLGIQSLSDKAIESVHRNCRFENIMRALEIIQNSWNGKLSVDFIAGLPNQTYKSFEAQFSVLDKYPKIDHVSLYSLCVEEKTPLYGVIQNGIIKYNSQKTDKMWISGRNILEKKGFFQYEVSNFAKVGFESQHNLAYWNLENYIGCGAGAVGTIYGNRENPQGLRLTNTFSIEKYIDFWRNKKTEIAENEIPREIEILDSATQSFEYLMTGFRKLSGVSSADYKKRFASDIENRIGVFGGVFSEWKKNGLACEKKCGGDVKYFLNKRGIILLNRFLESLL